MTTKTFSFPGHLSDEQCEAVEKLLARIAELEAFVLKLGGQLAKRDELLQRALDEDDPDAGGMSSRFAADIAAVLAPKT